MEAFDSMWTSVQSTALITLPDIVGYLPSLAGALAVLLVGWLLARLARAASSRIMRSINRGLETTFRTGILASIRFPSGASAIFGEAVFWVVVFLTMTIAARIAQLPTISRWLNEIVRFLPDILFGIVTILVGYFVSVVIGEHARDAARNAKSAHSELFGRIVRGAVFFVAVIIGLDQIGVDVTFLVTISAVTIGAILLGFSIAFGFGSREYVSNLISARTVRQSLSAGVMVRIGETEGEVLEITQTHIAVDTENGRALVPAHIADESGIVIISNRPQSAGEGA